MSFDLSSTSIYWYYLWVLIQVWHSYIDIIYKFWLKSRIYILTLFVSSSLSMASIYCCYSLSFDLCSTFITFTIMDLELEIFWRLVRFMTTIGKGVYIMHIAYLDSFDVHYCYESGSCFWFTFNCTHYSYGGSIRFIFSFCVDSILMGVELGYN